MWLLDTNALIESARQKIRFQPDKIFVSIFSLVEFPPAIALEGFNVVYPDEETWNLALSISRMIRERGTPIPAIDLLIGCVGIQHSWTVVSNDRHFSLLNDAIPELQLITTEEYLGLK